MRRFITPPSAIALRLLVSIAPIAALGCAPASTMGEDVHRDTATVQDDGTTQPTDVVDVVPGSCTRDQDCAADRNAPVCDTAMGRCVRCTADNDTCPPTHHCDGAAHVCVAGCRADEGCTEPPRLVCDVTSHTCLQCRTMADCPAGHACIDDACVPRCDSTTPCAAGMECCGGACVDVSVNTGNCGACGTVCTATNGEPACTAGMCGVNFCYLPHADCNGAADDGCESDLSSDPMHCGACSTVCAVPANGSARCTANRCGIVCDTGFADCRNGVTDGCETSIATDPANCGACRTVCAAAPNAAAACNAGTCAISCNGLFLNCDSDDTNGCEIDSGNDPTHCGNCTRRCGVACGTGACITATQIGIGPSHGCARMSDGSARCWGLGTSGQLGNGAVLTVTTPVTVLRDSPRVPLDSVVEVAAGGTHSCAVLADHTVACWGANSVNQLGDGTTTARRAAIVIPALTGVAEVVAGTSHTCARMMDGTVRCWGTNASGQIGIGSTSPAATPNLVPGLIGVTQVVAGSAHTCALLMDGTVRCWGANGSGQIGDATTTNRTSPTVVASLAGVRGLTAGASYTCAWLTDGTARCWGRNADGQLGTGAVATSVTSPTAVTGLTGVTSMAAGTSHTCALLTGGAVRCWGLDQYGQQCDGAESPDPVTSPAPIASLASSAEIGLGATHTCVRLASGNVRCCGNNEFGQLGSAPIAMGANPSPITVAW